MRLSRDVHPVRDDANFAVDSEKAAVKAELVRLKAADKEREKEHNKKFKGTRSSRIYIYISTVYSLSVLKVS